MKIYGLNFDYIKNLFNDIGFQLIFNLEQSVMLFALLTLLVTSLVLSRKVLKLEKIQFNDIDDVTSFNRLIDDELVMLQKEQNKLNKVLKSIQHKFKSNSESSSGTNNEGKLFNNAPYTQAVQLAKRGYAREDIISLCSLTESEAELILALHSDNKAA